MSTDPTPDQLTAFLAAAEYHTGHIGQVPEGASESLRSTGCFYAPRLVAAVQAGQKLADDWEAKAAHLDAAADRVPDGEPGGVLKLARAQAHEDCARELREAISGALLGEENTDAH